MENRHYTAADHLLINLDTGLRTLFGRPLTTDRPDPADASARAELTPAEQRLSGRLMRVNHAGEVAAQGLYQGQALTARSPGVREAMARSAVEENDHLAWCERRVRAAGSHLSHLNPFWYVGSVAIGALAGVAGDRWSLGFVAATEDQVVQHLDGHLARLPEQDARSRAVLEQMREDEARHAAEARRAGAHRLPAPVRALMRISARVMTGTAYWV